ncbi:hypothetical protein SAMN05216371_2145 [Streptomyces sp. TLI_053]|nr:hypothetical protein SAMN05216371_2145 [Streptomyces sp. TLI_053]
MGRSLPGTDTRGPEPEPEPEQVHASIELADLARGAPTLGGSTHPVKITWRPTRGE